MVWLWLAACHTASQPLPESIEDCLDPACREAWILHPDHNTTQQQVAALTAITDPTERIVVVKKLLDINPRRPEICGQLPPGDALQYCKRIQQRPHLSETPPPVSTAQTRPGGGPSNMELGGGIAGGFVVDLTPLEPDCAASADVRACRSEAALVSADAGRMEEAVRVCLSMEAGRWRGECLFSTAETGLKSGSTYARSMEVCMAATPYTQQCHSHLISAQAIRSPGATSPASDWVEVVKAATSIETAWAAYDPAMGRLMVDRFWSEAVRLSYLEQRIVGDPLDHLPLEAAPHIRAAITRRLLEDAPSPQPTLADWVTVAEAALAARSEAPQAPMSIRNRRKAKLWVRDRWQEDGEGEDTIPATFYMGSARRPTDPDPAIDLQLCLMEGIAGQSWATHSLFKQVEASETAVVAWSARRLRRTLPGH